MTVIETIVEKVGNLSVERQREVLDFAEYLQYKEESDGGEQKKESNGGKPRRSLEGMWKGVDISAEDIDEARREMWGNFPREDF